MKAPTRYLLVVGLVGFISCQQDIESKDKVNEEQTEKIESNLNKSLAQQLDSILATDQKYRNPRANESFKKKYGSDSKEVKERRKQMHEIDSINLIKVKAILDQFGWLGRSAVGEDGNVALFLVIQHADLETQEIYLPMLKEAVKNGKAEAADLALLVDRIEGRNGKPQVYGSQVQRKAGKYEVKPIIDEVNVNNRRAEVGLEPLEDYLRRWNIDYKLPSK